MSISSKVACDAGNDTIKVKVSNHLYFVNSILKNNPKPRKVFAHIDEGDPIDFLDVSVELNGITGNYHVGELACYGENQESIGGFKSENNMLLVCMMTTIAYALAIEYPNDTDFDINLGTGLPVQEFFWQNQDGAYDFSKVARFKNKLSGKHTVKFNTNLLGNKTINIDLSERNISIVPEGYAALSSLIMDKDINADFVQYTKKNALVMGLDIGSISCDVSAVMNSRYFPQGMFGLGIGMSYALDALCNDLKRKTGINDITRLEINKYLFDKDLKGIYTAYKLTFDLNNEKIPYYKDLANIIVHRFKERLKDNDIDIHRVKALFIVGGGSIEIGDIIVDALKNDIPEFVKFDGEEARVSNLMGYDLAVRGINQ